MGALLRELPARGAGLLTWWRRRAQRAPARQGSACRPPGVSAVPADPPSSGKVPAPAHASFIVVSRSRGRTWPGLGPAWHAEGVPLMIVKKVLTPYGRLSAAKLLATLCRVWPIEARPDGTGDVVANDAPVGSKSTDDV
jgi:hypothetical protein